MSHNEIVKSLRNKIPVDALRAQIMRDWEIAKLLQELEYAGR